MPADGEANSQLTVGHNTDRTFVVRGKKIGVFKHNEEGKLEYAATINKITTNSGKAFAPEKVRVDLSLWGINGLTPECLQGHAA